MKTKNIFKALAFAMLMPAVLLTTSCSKGDDLVNNTAENTETVANKGYALPVTVNVTRQGDGTRATYNESTKKLEFSTGDQLFVSGRDLTEGGAGQFAGTLDYVPATGKFSGTIYTRNSYSDTADALFSDAISITATLLPNGYESTGFLSIKNNNTTEIYDDEVTVHETFAFVASETAKANGVEQFSWERASTYSNGFALAPMCAVLNFTISGLEAGAQNVTLRMNKDGDYLVKGSVTPNALGVATFAVGVKGGSTIRNTENNLTVGSSNFTLPSSKTFEAGKIYNITRSAIPGALIGQFSVSNTKKVYFSKGNLQATYNGSSWTWAFAANQWDYIGDATGNTKVTATYPFISENATVDLFGWVGASSDWTDAAQYGITSSTKTDNTNGYGNNVGEGLKSDWGTLMGDGWRTLTGGSGGEWEWLLGPSSSPDPGTNCRTSSTVNGTANARFAKATVAGKTGMILFPDSYTHPSGVTAPTSINTRDAAYTANSYDATDWGKMEAAGCVFLPAAGWRLGNEVALVGDDGNYWSSTVSNENRAWDVTFGSFTLAVNGSTPRIYGQSVRLVRKVE